MVCANVEAGKADASSNKVLATGTRELFMGHTPVRRWIENDTRGVALEGLPHCDVGKMLVDTKKQRRNWRCFRQEVSVQFYTSSRPAKK